MLKKIQAHEWASLSKPIEFNAPPKCMLHINAASPGTLTLSGIDADTGEVITVMSCDRQLHIKSRFEGFSSFKLEATKAGSARVMLNAKEVSEPLNDEPAPIRKTGNNVIARMRETARQEMGITREAFMETEGIYDNEDEPDYQFEEEEFTNQQLKQKQLEEAPGEEPPADDPPPSDES